MIERFIRLKQLIKDPTVKNLAEPYLKKSLNKQKLMLVNLWIK